MNLKIVGVDNQEKVDKLLEVSPCFGKHYAKTVEECKSCTAPVVLGGKLFLMNEVCKARCANAESPVDLKNLTSRDVRKRLEEGCSVEEIFEEVLGDNDPSIAAVEARSLLYRRLNYIKTAWGLPVPELPTTEEIMDES